MALDKVLGRIQEQIKEVLPTLELFVEDSIHPTVKDCEKLQQQLNSLQENIAIYKYSKQEKELSPSFNIHAKVSEVKMPEPKIVEEPEVIKKEEKQPEIVIESKITVTPEVAKETQQEQPVRKTVQPLTFGINDKFRFINELFKQNASEYNIAVEQLESLGNWQETEVYLNSLKAIYNWKDNTEVVIYFYSVIKKRFA